MAGFVLLAVVDAPGRRLAVRPLRPRSGCWPSRSPSSPSAAPSQAFTPTLVPLGTIAFLAMAGALGAGSGATFALVALLAPRTRSARSPASSARPAVSAGSCRRWSWASSTAGTAPTPLGLAALAVVGRALVLTVTVVGARPRGGHRPGGRGALEMCEYCGCQAVTAIAELTREHDVVPSTCGGGRAVARRAITAAAVAAAQDRRRPRPAHRRSRSTACSPPWPPTSPTTSPRCDADHRRSRRCSARPPPDARDPTWPGRLAAALILAARAHPQGTGRGLPRRPGCNLSLDDWGRRSNRGALPVTDRSVGTLLALTRVADRLIKA